MASILFITREEKRKDFLAQVLGSRYFIITGNGNKERIESLIPLVELVIIDFSSLSWEGLDMISRIKRYSDSATIIGIGREVKEEIVKAARKRGLYEYVDVDRNLTLLPRLVREKIERDMFLSRFEEEKKLFKGQPALSPKSERKIVTSAEREFLEQMSSFLTCGYNLDELTNFFLNLIARKFGITRLCLLLKDRVNNIYRIKACLGLADHIKKYVQLHPERGLARWLTREGTVVTRESILNIDLKTAYEIKQEMKLIQSNVVIPLSPQGELIGILGLGPRITGEEMPSEEIKQIFLFSNQAGIAIQNLLYYEEMSYQKNYIENILKDASSGVISVDVEKKITTCNPRARKLLNLDLEDLKGQDIRRLPSPLGDLLYETLTDGVSHIREEVYVPAVKRWMGISTNQMKDAQGNVTGSLMIFTDLTPIKILEEERKKIQKMDFLSRVAARLSHELRNSFVPIKSVAELLPARYLDKEFQKDFFSVVKREIERIDDLIERLLFFSQPLKLDRTAQSVSQLVEQAIARVKEKVAESEKIKINVYPPKENLMVYVDRSYMIQALNHILVNSVEALPDKNMVKVNISFEILKSVPENFLNSIKKKDKKLLTGLEKFVKIEIKDTGPGLPEGKENKIFDPFFTTKNRGIGLGLTISQSIIEEHGGFIVARSEKGKGTTMLVYLPLYQIPE